MTIITSPSPLYTRRPPPTRLNIHIRHRIIVRPLLHLLKIPAHMLTLIIRPVPLFALLGMERKHIHIGQTHQVHAQNLDAVV
jgi:hypothetical protein